MGGFGGARPALVVFRGEGVQRQRKAEMTRAAGEKMSLERVVYTRWEHGNLPVRVYAAGGRRSYELERATGAGIERYTSVRELLRAVRGQDSRMSFESYFRLGGSSAAKSEMPWEVRDRGGLLDLMCDGMDGASELRETSLAVHGLSEGEIERPKNLLETVVTVDGGVVGASGGVSGAVLGSRGGLGFDLEGYEKALRLEMDRLEGLVGIDLGERSDRGDARFRADEVRKLLWRGFAGKMLSQGYDPEDVLQEVYRGLLVRNRGRCPWDGRKSTFGHYVHMVIGCVLTNYHRKQVRRVDRDARMPALGEGGTSGDLGQWGSCEIEHGSEHGDRAALEGLSAWLDRIEDDAPEAMLGREILPLVASGHQRGEIVRKTGEKPSAVSRAMAWVRRRSAEWASSGGHEGCVPAKYKKS